MASGVNTKCNVKVWRSYGNDLQINEVHKLIKNHFINNDKTSTEQHPNKKRERWPEEHPDRNSVNERSACNDHPTHSLCLRERETQTETQEIQASEEIQSEEERCMEADVHQHGTSQAAREELWLPWKQGRLPFEEMLLNKPLNINPVGRVQTSQ